ncbi:MAG: bifunctional phosphopantothenoylcysteine decarboxylase/phosphopantothenate--cysteine ligase CoaBC [Nitrospirae bacterium]|nr:bifunctional phosphopantothenoylcysteine decarboxylase/phosphopantothenate--cysteine ligase CoaBC [Nitrospirota bacterium]
MHGKRILLGVTGSIAAYKCPELVRRLQDRGATVTVVMTEAAARFVTPLTLQTISRRPVYTQLFDPREEILHLTLVEEADLFLIAPATANFIGKAASGLADDLLSTLFLAARGPVLLAPAMDAVMWDHPVTRGQLRQLREAGIDIVGPEAGPLASGLVGMGRLADPEAMIAAAAECLVSRTALAGERVLVTAGPTREPLDPVRFLSNRSSGKMGYAIARTAARRGAHVTLISGPTALPLPFGVEVVTIETAADMAAALDKRFPDSTILIMAAAVADYRPKAAETRKIARRSEGLRVELEAVPDLLAQLRPDRPRQLMVGFAAETEELVPRATRKLRSKQLDLIAANLVGPSLGFDMEEIALTLLDRTGGVRELGLLPKTVAAGRLLDAVVALRQKA